MYRNINLAGRHSGTQQSDSHSTLLNTQHTGLASKLARIFSIQTKFNAEILFK